MKIKRVYVAGSYNAGNAVDVLNNMRVGMRKGTEILLMGLSPFVPWFDYHFQLMLRGDEDLRIIDYYRYSLDWLAVSDVMYLLPHSGSGGTKMEIEFAKANDIPIVDNMEDLRKLVEE